MASELDDLLTLSEAGTASGIGMQTLRKAVGTPEEPGLLKVAKWTKRGEKDTPLLIYRDDLLEWTAKRPGKGFASMESHYSAVMEKIASVLTENQMNHVRMVMPFDDYKRLHYSADKVSNTNGQENARGRKEAEKPTA